MSMGRKRGIQRCISAILAVLGLLLFFRAAVFCGRLIPLSSQISGVYKNQERAPAAEEVFEKLDQGSMALSVTWWQRKGREEIESRGTGRTAETEILALCGRSDRLFPGAAVLDYDQTSYCLLGRRTASRLFGSRNAAGLQVEYGGQSYEVKAVLPDIEDSFVYEAGTEADLLFSRVTAACDDIDGQVIIKNKVESLLLPDEFLDYPLLTFLAEMFLMFIPAGTGCRIFGMYRHYWKKEQGIKRILLQATSCLLLVILVCFIGCSIHVPADFFPPRWSDFTFWTELWHGKKTEVLLLLETELASPDLIFMIRLGKMAVLNVCSILCFVWAGKLRKAG